MPNPNKLETGGWEVTYPNGTTEIASSRYKGRALLRDYTPDTPEQTSDVEEPNDLRNIDLLRSAYRKLEAVERTHYGKTTSSQSEAILAIGDGAKSQKDVASVLGCTGGNVTMILDNLEEKGMVERARSSEDRRVMNVTLTTKGKKALKDTIERRSYVAEGMFSDLSVAEDSKLTKILTKIIG